MNRPENQEITAAPMNKRDQIIEIIRQVSGKNLTPAPDESLFESGMLDSFALTDLVTELENKFNLKIPDSALNPRKFDTVELIEQNVEEWGS